MATYKVIQDIEAEDKLLGPLTLKQFLFAAVTIILGFLAFTLAVKTVWFVAIPFVPPILLFGILAAPLGRDQPTDIWLAAQIRFFLKPRKRIWDQSGIKELVTITVPKKLEHFYTDGLSQQDVRSRLEALASTIDSRGWAVKNVDINMYGTPAYAMGGTDRLVDPSSLPQAVTDIGIHAADDILDATSNPVAMQLDQMVQQSSKATKQAAIQRMDDARQKQANVPQAAPIDYSFINQQATPAPTGQAVFSADPVVAPGTSMPTTAVTDTQLSDDAEQALLTKIKEEKELEKHNRNPHHKTIKTADELAEAEAIKKIEEQKAQAVTTPTNPVNIELAKDNDLSVSTIAGLAKNKVSHGRNEGEIRIQH